MTKFQTIKQDPYATKYHADGTVTVWDVYEQRWVRTGIPTREMLESCGSEERERIIRHTATKNNNE